MDNTFTTCGKVSENTTRQIFNNYQKLKLDSVRMNNPGNVYYFIEYKSGGHVSNRIVWGKDPLQNPDITIYFSMLTDAVKKFRNPTVSP